MGSRGEWMPPGTARQAGGGAREPARGTSGSPPLLRLQPRVGNRAATALLPRGGGRPLAPPVRARMEPLLDRDLAEVRVHTGTAAADAAHALGARAFALGRDVVFGRGEYRPWTPAGGALLAHEVAHTLQQRDAAARPAPAAPQVAPAAGAAEREAEAAARALTAGRPFRVRGLAPPQLARVPLPVAEIRRDIEEGLRTPEPLYSWLHVMGERSGEVGAGARAPAGSGPDPAPVPTDPALPIEAHFFPSYRRHDDKRALVIGGIHGDELPGHETADALVAELASGGGVAPELFFHTLIIPHANPGGIADVSRCNRQRVDLNRNFPIPGVAAPSVPRCPNTASAPVQPETQAIVDVIRDFQPHRIVSLHAISSVRKAGIFADPETDPAARQLACSMARLVVDPSNRRGNRVTPTSCDPVYGGGSTGGTSLGSYAPTRSIPGETVPVITTEAPGYGTLGSGARTTEAFLRPLRGFLTDPARLEERVDLDLLRDVEALALPERRLFLTGRVPAADDLLRRVRERVEQRVAELNALRPAGIPAVTIVSHHRGFTESATGTGTRARGQGDIVFEKFTLTGSHASGWDTLPDRYFVGGNRSAGVDTAAWLGESSATRLDVILRYSAVPGASRHHWGTDVDFNSTTVADWEPAQGSTRAGRFHDLGLWLDLNAARAGFLRSYTPGRSGGHHDEAWHFSYAPIALRLRQLYLRDVRITDDVTDPMLDFFNRRAAARRITLPTDLPAALAALDVGQYVHTVGPGL